MAEGLGDHLEGPARPGEEEESGSLMMTIHPGGRDDDDDPFLSSTGEEDEEDELEDESWKHASTGGWNSAPPPQSVNQPWHPGMSAPFQSVPIRPAVAAPAIPGHPVGCMCKDCQYVRWMANCPTPPRQQQQQPALLSAADERAMRNQAALSGHVPHHDPQVYPGLKQSHPRGQRHQRPVDMRDMRPTSGRMRLGFWKTVLMGAAVIAILAMVYQRGWVPDVELLPTAQYPLLPPGHGDTRPSLEVTEEDARRGLLRDVSIQRVLIDMKTHLLANEHLSCLCMHHMGGFAPQSRPEEALQPRRLCAVVNRPGTQVDYMANPRAIGQSKDGKEYTERSLSCRGNPTNVVRAYALWVEWDSPVAAVDKPVGQQRMVYTRRFQAAQAACLALAIEELDGKQSCQPARQAPDGVDGIPGEDDER